jgi:hypothetical protein
MNKTRNKSVFQQVFFTVFMLTLVSGGTSFWLASYPNLSPQQNRIFEIATITWQVGMNTIFGLLGSNTLEALQQGKEK